MWVVAKVMSLSDELQWGAYIIFTQFGLVTNYSLAIHIMSLRVCANIFNTVNSSCAADAPTKVALLVLEGESL